MNGVPIIDPFGGQKQSVNALANYANYKENQKRTGIAEERNALAGRGMDIREAQEGRQSQLFEQGQEEREENRPIQLIQKKLTHIGEVTKMIPNSQFKKKYPDILKLAMAPISDSGGGAIPESHLPSIEDVNKMTDEEIKKFRMGLVSTGKEVAAMDAATFAAELERGMKKETHEQKMAYSKQEHEQKMKLAGAKATDKGKFKYSSSDDNAIKKSVADLFENPVTGMPYLPTDMPEEEFQKYIDKLPNKRAEIASKATRLYKDGQGSLTHSEAVVKAIIETGSKGEDVSGQNAQTVEGSIEKWLKKYEDLKPEKEDFPSETVSSHESAKVISKPQEGQTVTSDKQKVKPTKFKINNKRIGVEGNKVYVETGKGRWRVPKQREKAEIAKIMRNKKNALK